MNVINMTQHPATAEQEAEGVIEPQDVVQQNVVPATKEQVQNLLTFNTLPTSEELFYRATELAQIAMYSGCEAAMIGGAPFFMSELENALRKVGVKPVYAFSIRDSIEQPDGNGGVRKVNVFRHAGWVEV
jgi:hypothetical protein